MVWVRSVLEVRVGLGQFGDSGRFGSGQVVLVLVMSVPWFDLVWFWMVQVGSGWVRLVCFGLRWCRLVWSGPRIPHSPSSFSPMGFYRSVWVS